jgi:hypothetical protein
VRDSRPVREPPARGLSAEPALLHEVVALQPCSTEAGGQGDRAWAAHIPEEHGGGAFRCEFAHMSEELGKSPIGHYLFNCQAPDVGNMEILMEYGTPEQQQKFLAPLVRGEIRSCFSMTEPEFAGSNPVWMGTTAKKEGGEWVIRGHKWFASAADGAAFAICMAVTDPEADPYQRASMIIVPTDTPGFELIGNISVMGDRGGDWASSRRGELPGRARAARTLLGPEGPVSSSPSSASGPGASTTACAGSASASGPSRSCAGTPPPASSPPASPSEPSRSSSNGSPRAAPRSTPPA